MPTTPGSRQSAAPIRPTAPQKAAQAATQQQEATIRVGQLLNTSQVAHQLQLDERTVRRYITEGQLRGYRVGRGYRVHPAHLASFLADSQVGA